ncbi:YbfB/YjiJ family MFS transporter [Moraxella sp. VT-16-12]|uniref:YbfB/YjiJ family MFS transporter n=1 Tax=Moraxella sp. VT-16-12 TaxID=2014877 RepID=UPI000B7F1F17|nr:YbfB/YjiJ family MFS transporter [Moraxella sp. VT-16-12]TWV82900.1 YbfB/YjiJ family MFS transporter [Moraxella sp. VT-16-12]
MTSPITNATAIKHKAIWHGLQVALILALVMGFGRFAYTALYPYMVADGVLTVAQGSIVASANYLGYLVGALFAVSIKADKSPLFAVVALLGTCACLGLMSVLSGEMGVFWLMAVRFLAGAFSAIGIVSASMWLLAKQKHTTATPLMYAGVGFGIALSSELVVWGVGAGFGSSFLWGVLAILALVLSLMVVRGLFFEHHHDKPQTVSSPAIKPKLTANALIILYGLAGFGYIITATYLPLLVNLALPDVNVGHIWAVFGLSAVPSCFVWHDIHVRFGTRWALTANLLTQVVGVMLSIIMPNMVGYLMSALLVGGAFMGTVTIVMPVAQAIKSGVNHGKNLIALATLAYSIGQIIAPLIAGGLYQLSQSFIPALGIATFALLMGAIIAYQKA